MRLLSTKQMLIDARKGVYAVGAFNAENAEMIHAISLAATKLCAPVIIQTTPSTLKYLPPIYFAMLMRAAIKNSGIPIALHLDHGNSFELAKECIDSGYSSVMIDGSHLPFEQNIELTSRVVEYANQYSIPVEAELGKIGGKEDSTESAESAYTNPEQAQEFVERTGISSLAVAIGTAHGIYAVTPVLDLNRVAVIKKLVGIPLVMHGGSGLSNEIMSKAIDLGISKINFATELRIAFTDAVKAYLLENPTEIDPKKYFAKGREAVIDLVSKKILVCRCENKKIQ